MESFFSFSRIVGVGPLIDLCAMFEVSQSVRGVRFCNSSVFSTWSDPPFHRGLCFQFQVDVMFSLPTTVGFPEDTVDGQARQEQGQTNRNDQTGTMAARGSPTTEFEEFRIHIEHPSDRRSVIGMDANKPTV